MASEAEIRQALREVLDPEIGKPIEDIGMLQGITVNGGHVRVDDYAIIGGMTPVHQFVTIGCHAFVGGASRVPQDVPPYVKAAGNPLRACGLNSIGMDRRGIPAEVRLEVKRAYRILYRSQLNVAQALSRITRELKPYPEIHEFVEFVRSSERGIVR